MSKPRRRRRVERRRAPSSLVPLVWQVRCASKECVADQNHRSRHRRRRLVCGVGRSDDERVSLAVMTWFDAPRSHWLLLWFVLGRVCGFVGLSPVASRGFLWFST